MRGHGDRAQRAESQGSLSSKMGPEFESGLRVHLGRIMREYMPTNRSVFYIIENIYPLVPQ